MTALLRPTARATALLLLGLLTACQDSTLDSGAKPVSEPRRLALPTAVVQTADIPDLYSVPGTVASDDRIELTSRVIGFIQRLEVREGQRVAKGDVLVRIDPAEIDEAIRQAQAGLSAARKDWTDAGQDVGKYTTLAERGWASAEVLRKARLRRDLAQAALDKAEAALAATQAQAGYAAIASPVDGIVVARHKQAGDLATAGTPILTIESRQSLLFRMFVAESQLARFHAALPVTVRIDALAGRAIQGYVQRIVPSGDTMTRRYEVAVALPADPALLPGMFGRAEIALGATAVPVIPPQAMARRGGLDGVFVVEADNTARFRWLRTGREWNGLTEVTAGLSAGERILLRTDTAVRDGALVVAEGTAHD